MYLALVVVPDLAAWLRKHGPNRQKKPHLLRLEDTTLGIDEGDAFAVENKSWLQLVGGQMIVDLAKSPHMLERSQANARITIRLTHAWQLSRFQRVQCADLPPAVQARWASIAA